jgi:HK97 family phage portal protein
MAFVVSAGQLAQTTKPVFRAPVTAWLAEGVTQNYATIWRTQPNVRTVISFLARNIAQLGLHTFRRVDETDRERLRDHPLAQLLGRPTPWTTTYRFFDTLVSDLGIYDNAITAKVRADGQPRALQRVDPRNVSPVGDNPFVPAGFEIRGNKGKQILPADQVIHWRGYNPDDSRWGCSPMETLRRILSEEFEAGRYREQLWRNQARASGYLKRPLDAPAWSKDGKERFRGQWQAQYTGGGPQAGGTPILEDGMEFVPAASTARDAQYIEARKLTREEVAAAFHIPLPMVGILEHATFSNIREQHKQLYQDCLGPWLQMIQQEIGLQLVDDFADTAGVYVEFNLAEKLRGSFEERAAQIQTSVGAPWMTRNEARALDNMPAVDGGDELVTPLNVLVGGQASPTDSAPPPRSESTGRVQVKARAPRTYVTKAEEVFSRFFTRQGQVVASRLGASKSRKAPVDDVFDVERWDEELTGDVYRLNALVATATAHTTLAAAGLDPDAYDEARTQAWLLSNAERVAGAVNATTRARIVEALASDDPLGAVRHLFEVFAAARAVQAAAAQVTSISGFGTTEAARQTGREATKTWVVLSSSPRPSHAAMSGETVGLDDNFSNGAAWPGDANLDVDERAGCTCDLELNFP